MTVRRLLPTGAFLLLALALATVLLQPSSEPAGAASSPGGASPDLGPASGAFQGVQGDVDCNLQVNAVDSLKILRHDAGLSVAQEEPCPDIATVLPGLELLMGDVNCDGAVTPVDSLLILRFDANLSVNQTEPCIDIGQPLQGFEGFGDIEGNVVNAVNAEAIEGADVRLLADTGPGCSGTPEATTTSNAQGEFQFMDVAAGIYDIDVSADDFLDSCREGLFVLGDQITMVTISLSPPLEVGEIRIVLSWGVQPTDLDSHLWLPPEHERYHIYFLDEGNQDDCPFAELDVDDVTSFGPETVTITERFDGTYVYAVHNYSDELGGSSVPITQSNAQVQVFGEGGLIQSFSVPASGSGFWWHVFNMNGETGAITPINTIGGNPAPYLDFPQGC